MIHHHIVGEFTDEYLTHFIDIINSISADENPVIHVYIDSNGGSTGFKDIIVSILNKFEHVIYFDTAESAAFDMVVELKGKIVFLPCAYGMYHLGSSGISVRDGLMKNSLSKLQEDLSLYEYDRTKRTMSELKFTDDERKAIMNKEDLYFNRKRLIEMFADRIKVT